MSQLVAVLFVLLLPVVVFVLLRQTPADTAIKKANKKKKNKKKKQTKASDSPSTSGPSATSTNVSVASQPQPAQPRGEKKSKKGTNDKTLGEKTRDTRAVSPVTPVRKQEDTPHAPSPSKSPSTSPSNTSAPTQAPKPAPSSPSASPSSSTPPNVANATAASSKASPNARIDDDFDEMGTSLGTTTRVLRITRPQPANAPSAVPYEDGWSQIPVKEAVVRKSPTADEEALSKKQRENMARAAKKKAAKAQADALQEERLRKHQRELLNTRINEFYKKPSSPSSSTANKWQPAPSSKRPTSTASLNEKGKLIWD
ncbi:hypothetical protein BC940DRAFT_320356 [Gongronella butleri]|nr:hypothetical protein BC940DRAFT_320356 [Gongronella butleri]